MEKKYMLSPLNDMGGGHSENVSCHRVRNITQSMTLGKPFNAKLTPSY